MIAEHNYNDLKFLLHQKLDSLAYVKAPLLEEKLFYLHTEVYNNTEFTQDVYRDVEHEVFRVVEYYKNIAKLK